jgi:glycosyltransferase involved in cell wall biosynthesis
MLYIRNFFIIMTAFLKLRENHRRNFMATSASILCVGNSWFPKMPGGLNRYVYELLHHLAAGQDRVELCGVGLPETELNPAIKLTNLAEPGSPLGKRLWLTRTHFLRRQMGEPDAINLHFALYSLPLLNLLPKSVPITFTFHGPWALEGEREGNNNLSILIKYWLEQRVYNRCDRFIVLSKAFGTILHEHYQISWDKIHIIPGGVDTNRFQPNLSPQQAREQLNWPQDRKILFTPRRLVQRMGIDTLLTALAKIKSKVPDVWLAVAGKGKLRDSLEQQATELGLNNHVKFLGYLPDEQLPVAYQAADLTVVPSQSLEGFGLILLESLACGTPVVCTPVGGMPEILAPFSPELITDSTHEDAIALRLEALLKGELPMPSHTACRDYTTTHFNWFKIAQQVKQVLLASDSTTNI